MFDTLMQRSWDELASEYALIADDVEVAPTGCRPRFTSTRPRASRTATRSPRPTSSIRSTRWRAPSVADRNAQFSIIKRAVVVDSHTIRFEFSAERDAALIAGDLPVFSPKWGSAPTVRGHRSTRSRTCRRSRAART
jgi:microcin C transport system substrate-binding protein